MAGSRHIRANLPQSLGPGHGHLTCDYQLTYLYKLRREILGDIVGNRIRISIPSIIDNFERFLTDEVVGVLNVILLHELSHWADERDYGDDLAHVDSWNSILHRALVE